MVRKPGAAVAVPGFFRNFVDGYKKRIKIEKSSKINNNSHLTNCGKGFTITMSAGVHQDLIRQLRQESARKEVGADASALCYPGSTLTLQTTGAYCAHFCGRIGRTFCVYTAFPSHRLRGRRWYFYAHFSAGTERRWQK